MTRVHFLHNPSQVQENTGIGRVLHAQHRYLSLYGIEIVDSPSRAEVIVAHAEGWPDKRIDVVHLHGLYWTGDAGSGVYTGTHHEANKRIAASLRRARRVTVPSAWVAGPLLRDMRITPEVVPHGIELDQWGPSAECRGYAFWNKNRASDVCDPLPAVELAARGIPTVSTFTRSAYPRPSTLQVIGQIRASEMRKALSQAGVYIATTKETFGVGTLEALACGVPVLGFNHGGTADIIEHLTTGYLVEPGDYDGLAEGYAWLMRNRERISGNCLRAAQRYTWDTAMEMYARIYHEVAEEIQHEQRGVSIIITNYNYGRYVGHAIESCLQQTVPPDRIIVVDDGSTDESAAVLDAYQSNPSVEIVRQQNQGVAAARNRGIRATETEHLICLDADDMLDRRTIQTLLPILQSDRGLGIAYGGLSIIGEDNKPGPPQAFPPAFNWTHQARLGNPPHTCVPCAAMFRRDMWERAGGFQQLWAPGEDAEFWTRGLSIGFDAVKVTEEPLLWYRIHPEASASHTKHYRAIDTWLPWLRDGVYPFAAPATKQPLVRSYSNPLVSVRIYLRDGQQTTLPAALDSLLGQTMREWEVIIEPAGYVEKVDITPYPFVRVGPVEPRAPFVLRMTAGQYLPPMYLEEQLRAYVESGELRGGLEMCGCSKKSPSPKAVQKSLSTAVSATSDFDAIGIVEPGVVKMRYLGDNSGPIPFKSPKTRKVYTLTKRNPVLDVMLDDVDLLLSYHKNDRSPLYELLPVDRPSEPPAGGVEPTVPQALPFDPAAVMEAIAETPAPKRRKKAA